MKVPVVFIIVIANISNNGKASLDSFVPSSNNMLLQDTTKNTDKSCYRPCKLNVKPRRCHYHFKIEPAIIEDGKPALIINGMSPGPPINVCLNDIIVVEVENKVPDQDIALHWHGIEQKGTAYMDGVPMITQCPIGYGTSYKYAFIATKPGTFFYHSDSVSHQSDGVYGALIINNPQAIDPQSSLYDYDRSKENTIIIGERFSELMTGSLEDSSLRKPNNLLINGDQHLSKIFVLPSYAYRLRIINAIALECSVVLRIEDHEMTVIATDGRPVKAVTTKTVQLYPGERMDVVVRASQPTGGYWIKVDGVDGACTGLRANAMFLYSGYNYTEMLTGVKQDDSPETEDNTKTINGQMLKSLHDASFTTEVKKIYLGIDKNLVKFNESDNDFRYISDALREKPFFPASLSLRKTGVVQINHKNFLYPSTPLLLKSKYQRSDVSCFVGAENLIPDTQCVQQFNGQDGEWVELALVNEGAGGNDSYTFHMHGYSMNVLVTRWNSDGIPLTKNEFERLDEERKIIRNLKNPVVKDTITVPNKGYVIVRMRLHPGTWMLECRSCSLQLPAAIVINVPLFIPKTVVDSLPKCGTYKPPDVLLN